jgi:phage/plasmid-associated DNA primase
MSGRRQFKKFAVFTDKRAGNTGKSTFSNLLMRFFGIYAEKSTKFVCKGAFSGDKDSHDAGYEHMRARRLLVAEELKHTMMLDDAMLKSLSGGADNLIRGRRFGKDERFSYVWQAGILLVFNEGDCPKFDTGDQAFMERMVVMPFRSKFVADLNIGGDEEFTYPMDKSIDTRFVEWLPALADILLYHYDQNAMDCIPPSMREWRQDVISNVNPLSDWLQRIVEVTGDMTDCVTIPDLKSRFVMEVGKADTNFSRNVKGYFEGLRPTVKWIEVTTINNVNVRGIIRGARRKLDEHN